MKLVYILTILNLGKFYLFFCLTQRGLPFVWLTEMIEECHCHPDILQTQIMHNIPNISFSRKLAVLDRKQEIMQVNIIVLQETNLPGSISNKDKNLYVLLFMT